MTARWAAGIVLVTFGLGCVQVEPFRCTEDRDCGAGRCEPVGMCSVDDTSCGSNRRFAPSAGDLADTCVMLPCSGFVEDGRCYWVEETRKSWRDASKQCESRGGELVVIESADRDQTVAPLFGSTAWIGLGRPGPGEELLWSDGSPLGAFQPFGPGEPADDGCVARRSDGTWEGLACVESLPSVCQRDP